MVVVPGVPPETTPVNKSMVAIAGLLLVQVPPPASLKVVVAPGQMASVPEIAPGAGSTVTVLVVVQPVTGNVYVIIVTPPAGAMPVTRPVPAPMVAIPGLLLVQVPPPPSLNVVVDPGHTSAVPVMLPGDGLTVTVAFTVQPNGLV